LNYRSRAEVAQEGCCGWRWLTHPAGHALAAEKQQQLQLQEAQAGRQGFGAAAEPAAATASAGSAGVRDLLEVVPLQRYLFALFLYGWGFWVPTIHLAKFAQDIQGPDFPIDTLVSLIGLGSLCGRIPLAALADR
jgi:hypothetical protein